MVRNCRKREPQPEVPPPNEPVQPKTARPGLSSRRFRIRLSILLAVVGVILLLTGTAVAIYMFTRDPAASAPPLSNIARSADGTAHTEFDPSQKLLR
jgi:hypothetical protein